MSVYAVMPLEDYKNACDKIRELGVESEAIKSGELPQKIDEVYETGKEAGYEAGCNAAWDITDKLLQGKTIERYYNDRITKIGMYALANSFISKLDLPNVTRLDSYSLYRSKSLTDVNIPSVTSMGVHAFRESAICRVNISKVKTIEGYCFLDCHGLSRVIIGDECALSATNAFRGTQIEIGRGSIYVPDDLVETYKTATNWAAFASQIKGISELEG